MPQLSETQPNLPASRPGSDLTCNVPSTAHTSGQLFARGEGLELVRIPATQEIGLLEWRNGSSATVAAHIERGDRLYAPVVLDSSLSRVLLLPKTVVPHKNIRALLTEIASILERRHSLPSPTPAVLARFVLASWIPEFLPSAARVVLHGPEEDVLEVMKSLTALCRHALLLGTIDHRSFCDLVELVRPTILLMDPEPQLASIRLLAVSNHHGPLIPRGAAVSNAFCCKAIYAGSNSSRAVDAIHATVLPRGSASILTDDELHNIADHLQPQLLHYRFTFDRLRCRTSMGIHSNVPSVGAASALLTPVGDDPELQAATIEFLQDQLKEAAAEAATALHIVVIECALAICHQGTKRIPVKQLTLAVNAGLRGRGERIELADRKVGAILKSLQLFTEKLGGAGRGLVMTDATCRCIHHLAFEYQVYSVKTGKSCAICRGFSSPAK